MKTSARHLLQVTTGLTAVLSCAALQAMPWTVQVTNAAGKPLAGAAVAVEVSGRSSKTSTAKAEVGQRDRQFQPSVLVVQTGTAVTFPNFDVVRHHVYSFSPIKAFDIKLYSGTPAEPVVFDKPGVAALGCNIHDRMSAHIVVVDTPVFALTDANGLAKLELPAGEHRVKAWHASLKAPSLQALPQPLIVGSEAQASGAASKLVLAD